MQKNKKLKKLKNKKKINKIKPLKIKQKTKKATLKNNTKFKKCKFYKRIIIKKQGIKYKIYIFEKTSNICLTFWFLHTIIKL